MHSCTPHPIQCFLLCLHTSPSLPDLRGQYMSLVLPFHTYPLLPLHSVYVLPYQPVLSAVSAYKSPALLPFLRPLIFPASLTQTIRHPLSLPCLPHHPQTLETVQREEWMNSMSREFSRLIHIYLRENTVEDVGSTTYIHMLKSMPRKQYL